MADIKHTIFYVVRSAILAALLITAGLAAGLDWLKGPAHAIGGAGGAGSNGCCSGNSEFDDLSGTFTGTVISGLYGGGGSGSSGARITLKNGETMDLDDYLAARNAMREDERRYNKMLNRKRAEHHHGRRGARANQQ